MPAYAKKTCHGVKDYQSSDYSAFGLGARFLKKNNDEAETFLPFKKVLVIKKQFDDPFPGLVKFHFQRIAHANTPGRFRFTVVGNYNPATVRRPMKDSLPNSHQSKRRV